MRNMVLPSTNDNTDTGTTVVTATAGSSGAILTSTGMKKNPQTSTSQLPLVLQDLHNFLTTTTITTATATNNNNDTTSSSNYNLLFDMGATAVPVAAIKALLGVVERSTSETLMGLQEELKIAADCIINHHLYDNTIDDNNSNSNNNKNNNSFSSINVIALQSGCELFVRYVTRTFLELSNFEQCRQTILQRGTRFHTISSTARDRLAQIGADFVPSNGTVLTHGLSRSVASVLLKAKYNRNIHFDLIVVEGRPDCSGIKAAQYYSNSSNSSTTSTGTNSSNSTSSSSSSSIEIPVTVILDSAVGYIMEQIDIVLIGAEAVTENGGIVNKIGTLSMCSCAYNAGKPVYVAVESYKFARLYPLSQNDLPTTTTSTTSTTTNITIPRNSSTTSPLDCLDFVDTTVPPVIVPKVSIPKSLTVQQQQQQQQQDGVADNNNDNNNDHNQQHQQKQKKEQQQQQEQNYNHHYYPKIQYDSNKIHVQNPLVDFTPAKYITLLFTDLGVLTPSAVSDELIRLYQ